MRPKHILLTLAFVFILAGLSTAAGDPSLQPAMILPEGGSATLSDLTPFDVSEVWTESTGSLVVDIVVDNFDADALDEVAVVTENGTLYLYDSDSTLLWRLNISVTTYAMVSLAIDAGTVMELLIGTSNGILVIDGSQNILTDVTLPNAVQTVVGADVDGDSLDEIVAGCDDNRVYAYDVSGTELWSHPSNGQVRVVTAADIDSDASDEILAGSELGRFSLLDNGGGVMFEITGLSPIRVVDTGNIDGAGEDEVLFGAA
ncbi:MAG: hypothetical protein ACXADF_14110, partial [Candidatus Thorarchaeota archaeon]